MWTGQTGVKFPLDKGNKGLATEEDLQECITEMPMEYLSADWLKPTKAESDSQESR
jgi:hypothetical protein